jgi:hypothetical protein
MVPVPALELAPVRVSGPVAEPVGAAPVVAAVAVGPAASRARGPAPAFRLQPGAQEPPVPRPARRTRGTRRRPGAGRVDRAVPLPAIAPSTARGAGGLEPVPAAGWPDRPAGPRFPTRAGQRRLLCVPRTRRPVRGRSRHSLDDRTAGRSSSSRRASTPRHGSRLAAEVPGVRDLPGWRAWPSQRLVVWGSRRDRTAVESWAPLPVSDRQRYELCAPCDPAATEVPEREARSALSNAHTARRLSRWTRTPGSASS